jgi:hypothetical protein
MDAWAILREKRRLGRNGEHTLQPAVRAQLWLLRKRLAGAADDCAVLQGLVQGCGRHTAVSTSVRLGRCQLLAASVPVLPLRMDSCSTEGRIIAPRRAAL